MKRQIKALKKKHPDAIFLCREGDFFVSYDDDAKVVADVLHLGITDNVCRFPHHALDVYLPRLVRAGKRVAICDQLDEPKPLVKRGITEVVTPKND